MWRSKLTATAFGFVGVILALLLYHLYTDHAALHAVIDILGQHGEAIRALQSTPR